MAVREEYLQKVQGGSQHVLYRGLLAMAHEKWGDNNWSMSVKVLQFPTDDNNQTTITTATVTTPNDMSFTEIGDANPENVGRHIAPHSIRMAATRAKGRALRDALNIGEAMYEEVAGGEYRATASVASHPDTASKGQVDLLKRLTTDLRGDDGVERFEQKLGKKVEELTTAEASEWIDRLSPKDG